MLKTYNMSTTCQKVTYLLLYVYFVELSFWFWALDHLSRIWDRFSWPKWREARSWSPVDVWLLFNFEFAPNLPDYHSKFGIGWCTFKTLNFVIFICFCLFNYNKKRTEPNFERSSGKFWQMSENMTFEALFRARSR